MKINHPDWCKAGNKFFFNNLLKKNEAVSLVVNRIETDLPFALISAELRTSSGEIFWGFGTSYLINTAMKKAVGEAWERYFMNCASLMDPGTCSSNGFASGSTAEFASIASREELIERATVLIAWQNKIAWKLYSPQSYKVRFIKKYLLKLGWKVDFFFLKVKDLGLALSVIAQHHAIGSIFDSTFSEAKMGKERENKLVLSVLKSIGLIKYRRVPLSYVFPEIGTPLDHCYFYLDPNKNNELIDIFKNGKECDELALPEHEKIKTQIIVADKSLPIVAHSYNNIWPELKWGSQSIAGINSWPHPIA